MLALILAMLVAPPAPHVPIAYATTRAANGKSLHEGEIVTLAGTANIDSAALYRDVTKFYIEDDKNGIAVFSQQPLEVHVALGDVVRVTGAINTWSGSIELIVQDVEVISHGRAPQPQIVSASELLTDRYYGRLIQTRGQVLEIVRRQRGTDVRVHAGRDLITLHITETQQKQMPQFETGETLLVTGIGSTFIVGNPPRPTPQILPRYASDIEVVHAPPLFTRGDAMQAAAIAGLVVMLIVVWNISLRRRVQREIAEHRESEARFEAVAETAPVAIFIYQGTVFRYVNHAAEQITGYSTEELVGREFWHIVDPEFAEMIRERGAARLRGEPVAPRYEFRIIRKDGSRVWLDFSATTIQYGGEPAALGTAFDITERKRAEEILQQSEKRFRELVENSSDAIALLDPSGTLLWVGPSTERVLGYTESESIGQNALDLVHRDDRRDVESRMETLLRTPRASASGTFRARAKDGRWLWLEMIGTNLLDEPAVGAIVTNYRDVSERKKAEEEMKHQALHDTLTGLPNRNLYQDRLGLALAHARRSGRPLAVMFVDIDLFKLINDNLGHTIGDRLLQEVGQRLSGCVRSSDTVARVGGDEFIVVIEDLERTDTALDVADKVLEAIGRTYAIDGHQLHVTASVGISIFPNDTEDADALTRNADKAMYRAKELGRNNVQLFTPEMNDRYRSRLLFEAGFRRALDQQNFVLHYQPIVAARDGRAAGVEALVRWQDPERGLVFPDEFIPAAEETRMIIPLGAWVLRTACEQLRDWLMPDMQVSVNLSVRQFHQRDLLAMVDAVLRETKLDAAKLELEITESVAMQNVDLTRSLLQELRARGVRIAIDDFGAGQSSLLYLRQFPINTIKIDRVFVHEITSKASDAAIVGAVIRLAHDLGLTVTAEGVETEDQRDFLIARECDYLQGYLFNRPMAADEVYVRLRG
ncbi:MAG TPA: EAL domain-containing protein [Thermoanaerobaculia bacterium]|nr:EAL domain-containing protein [Thermoanaerobaculia bacterium]